MKIFLSFSFRYQDQATALAETLRTSAAVHDVFLSSDALVGGQRWLEELQDKIHAADAFVFLLGEHVGSWQRVEFADAFDRKVGEDPARAHENKPPLPLVPVIFEEHAPATLLRRDERGLPFVQRLHLIADPDAFLESGNQLRTNPATLRLIEEALQGGGAEVSQLWRTLNPYRGLLALREQDADFLFGRDKDVADFITAIAEQPSKLLLALGASGVGKSSLIFGGVFAALERRTLPGGTTWPNALAHSRLWPRLALTPGAEPVYSLAAAFVSRWVDRTSVAFRKETKDWRKELVEGDRIDGLIDAADAAVQRVGGDAPPRYLIYVDQGEELYTRAGRDPGRDGTKKETGQQIEARRFSELLGEAAVHPRLIVLMSARSDFLDRLQADQPVHQARHLVEIEPLREAALTEVVRRPADLLNVEFDADLDAALVASAREQEGGLPLLSDTLDVLWREMQKRGDGVLRWTAPAEQGVNVARKLAERADAFVGAHRGQTAALQRLFCVRLAHVPSQGPATRQTFYLDGGDVTETERELVRQLATPEQRILATGSTSDDADGGPSAKRGDRPYAEVAHEALFTAWGTLGEWIANRRSFYAWATHLAAERKE